MLKRALRPTPHHRSGSKLNQTVRRIDLPTIIGTLTKVGIVLCSMSGKDMLKLYEQSGWVFLRQNGSHVAVGKGALRETIPMHRELKKGTEQKLLKKMKRTS